MKLSLILTLFIVLLANQVSALEELKLESEKDKISYSIGLSIGSNIKNQSLDIDLDVLARGMKDAYTGNKPLLSEQEVIEILNAVRKDMAAKQNERLQELAEKNKKEGEAFLAENKKKEGVTTLPSGLQYKVVIPGTGEAPKATDTVTANYRGNLVNGTEFDSSYKRGQPATFEVNRVIEGWTEALQLMKVGAKWQLFIPPHLAYGERGAGPHIGPNETLIFEVELLSIKK